MALPFENAEQELEHLSKLLQAEYEEAKKHHEELLSDRPSGWRRNQGLSWFPLLIRETGYGIGEYPFLVIERTKGLDIRHQFSSGKPVRIYPRDQVTEDQVTGTINWINKNTMKVTLQAGDHPDWLQRESIVVDILFDEKTFHEMQRALRILLQPEHEHTRSLRDKLLGYKALAPLKEAIYHNKDLNESQQQAVNQVLLSEDVAIIHGPPGTGKTTTLTAAITALSHNKKTVLACTPSNAAADLLVEKLVSKGLQVVRVGNLSRIDSEAVAHTIDARLTAHPSYKEIKKLRKRSSEYRELALKYKRHFGKSERDQRKLLLKEAKDISAEVVRQEEYLIQSMLNEAQVVVTTLVGATHHWIRDRQFDVAVVDEAAQALEPACWIPVLKARKIVLAGDPFQLPPVIKSAEAKGLHHTLIGKTIERLANVTLLDTQYRMNDTIMGFSNAFFYNNKLNADASVKNTTLPDDAFAPVEFIDTAGTGMNELFNPETHSISNEGEAGVILAHVRQLTEQGIISNQLIGCIAPYREQVRFLEEKLINEKTAISINTVDAFQGQERDIIYISLTRSNDKSEIGFLRDYRRMNVAMTRAKVKLVVVGDSATLGTDNFYNDFLSYAEKHGSYRTAWEFM